MKTIFFVIFFIKYLFALLLMKLIQVSPVWMDVNFFIKGAKVFAVYGQ